MERDEMYGQTIEDQLNLFPHYPELAPDKFLQKALGDEIPTDEALARMEDEAKAKAEADAIRKAAEKAKEVQGSQGAVDMWTQIPDDGDPTIVDTLATPMEDVYNGEFLPTGIRSIDSRLFRGIRAGGMCIIAGHEGGGKTSWAMQIIAKAMIEDEKRRQAKDPKKPPRSRGCLIFSSEMPSKKLHRILAHQLAAPGDIQPSDDGWGNTKYEVSKAVDDKIKKTYQPWIRSLEPELSSQGWRKMKETCERQAKAGRRYIVLDNLMTISNLVGMDPDHRGQGDNALQLAVAAWAAQLAAQYDAWVILIAHTRKATRDDEAMTNMNDLISGSKTVPNLASVVLFFTMLPLNDRQDDPDTSDRLARLTKNRDFDRKLTMGVRTQFDPASWTVAQKEKIPQSVAQKEEIPQ